MRCVHGRWGGDAAPQRDCYCRTCKAARTAGEHDRAQDFAYSWQERARMDGYSQSDVDHEEAVDASGHLPGDTKEEP